MEHKDLHEVCASNLLENVKLEDVDIKEEYKNKRKYINEAKHLLPFRPRSKRENELPSGHAGLFSYATVSWIIKIMCKAFTKGLEVNDLWILCKEDCSDVSCERLDHLWNHEQNIAVQHNKEPRLWVAVWKFMQTRAVVATIISILQIIIFFLGPSLFTHITLAYINSAEIDHYYALLIVVLVCGINLFRASLFSAMFVVAMHTGARVIGGIQGLLYCKLVKLKTGGEKLSAQIVNICSNDMERIFEAILMSAFILAMPILFILSAVYSVYVIGPWALVGLSTYFLSYPFMGAIARLQGKIRMETVMETDRRVALMGEILNSVRLIKMYSWEDSFEKQIDGIRHDELVKLRMASLLQAISSTVVPSIAILATIITFLGYTISVGVLPFAIRSLAEAKVSLARIQKLLELPEHEKPSLDLINNKLALQIKTASFSWEINNIDLKMKCVPGPKPKMKRKKETKKENINDVTEHLSSQIVQNDIKEDTEANNSALVKNIPTLLGINLSIEQGKLIGVCGSVGSGKSSLLSAICGDMHLDFGTVKVNGLLAIVTQQAWIYNDTFRENIIIGTKFTEKQYSDTIDACCLRMDISLLSDGDNTELGERGINLSGGQKQRINLARAVYSDRDIYLLDDPLSAVDPKVAKYIFSKCIQGLLKDRTVILVSHGIHFLSKCDEIIFMKDGRIAEKGTHEDLMEVKGGYFDLVGHDSVKDHSSIVPETNYLEDNDRKNNGDGKLIKEEEKERGSVQAKVYVTFIKVCGGWIIAAGIFLALIIFTATRLFNVVWLQIWLDAGDGYAAERIKNATEFNYSLSDEVEKGNITDNPKLWLYQLIYGGSFFIIILTGTIKGIWMAFRVLAGSSKLHNRMYSSIMKAPMSFFDTTPTGRILNRFSRDVDELDVRVPYYLSFVLQGIMFVFAQVCLVCYIYPWLAIPMAVIIGLFIFMDIFLNAGVRELKRIDNVLKSPVLQHITDTVSGLSVIRTFDRENLFISRFYKLLDAHTVSFLVFRLANRWFTYHLDIMAIIVITGVTAICVFTKGVVSTAIAGLAISTITGVCNFIPYLMRMKVEFLSRVTCLERILEYAYDITSEAPRRVKETDPDSSWPSLGAINICDLTLKYRPELPLVLHGISASILPAEKVGIVGRTGAGKSSLLSALLRIVEPTSGEIVIDGIDISTIGLQTLRSSISVIPQDPVLFHGTLRYNLDPFDEYTDERLWEALGCTHLKKIVEKLKFCLSSKVEAAGENFSVGERQLICLTRALLRRSKILFLDEATASVDIEMDCLIQKTIREEFESCTVLTIAHRLNTVASYDRILVVDAGLVKEFDTPENLLMKENSIFAEMMAAMGVTTLNDLRKLV